MIFETCNGQSQLSRDHLIFWSAKIGKWDLGGASNQKLAIWDGFQGQCATVSEQNFFFSRDMGVRTCQASSPPSLAASRCKAELCGTPHNGGYTVYTVTVLRITHMCILANAHIGALCHSEQQKLGTTFSTPIKLKSVDKLLHVWQPHLGCWALPVLVLVR